VFATLGGDSATPRTINKFIQEYRLYLNQLQLWNVRADFDVSIHQLVNSDAIKKFKDTEMAPLREEEKESFLFDHSGRFQPAFFQNPSDRLPYEQSPKCYFCLNSLSIKAYLQNFEKISMPTKKSNDKKVISHCPNTECGKTLPSCSVCLTPVGIMNPYIELLNKAKAGKYASIAFTKQLGLRNSGVMQEISGPEGGAQGENTGVAMSREIEEWMLWCQTCKHGGHAHHLIEWFEQQIECPVSSCHCNCLLND